jgi:hydrogenase small subunit
VLDEFSGWVEPTLEENLVRAGFDRRDFLKYCGELAAVFAVGGTALGSATTATAAPTAEVVAKSLGSVTKPVVVWLQLQECTGCMESVLRSGGTTIEEAVLKLLSVEYNELVMPAAGGAANKALDDANAKDHILVVNGSIPTKDGGIYCTINGESAQMILEKSAANASAIIAVGACAVWGSVQASKPYPTGAVGVDSIIKGKPVVNVAGCPPIGEVITATIAYLLTYGEAPKLDSQGRPLFAYDQRIHDSCTRRAHFDAGQYVRTFDDDGARNGWCLYEMGCKGPDTFAPCPIVKWNQGTSWPIGAGHPCLGCTEKNFFDNYTPFYQELPNVGAFGVESTAEKVGWGLVGATVAAVGIHAGVTAAKHAASRKSAEGNEPLQAFGDSERVWLPNPKKVEAETPDAPSADTTSDDSKKAE